MFATASSTDPLRIAASVGALAYQEPGRARRDPRQVAGEDTLVFVAAGQSNIANTATGGTYTPTHASKIDNLNFLDGGTYAAADPLIGGNGTLACWLTRFADKLIADGRCDRVILVPVAVGATSVAAWAPGGAYNDHLKVAARRCQEVGLTISAFLWQQGENDCASGMNQATYAGYLSGVIATPRALGFNAPWLIGKSTVIDATPTTSSAIRAACAAAVNGTDVFAGADTDGLYGSTYRETVGNIHFNAVGSDAAATLWKTAVVAALGL
jgi:hypothetical protein